MPPVSRSELEIAAGQGRSDHSGSLGMVPPQTISLVESKATNFRHGKREEKGKRLGFCVPRTLSYDLHHEDAEE